MAKAVTEVAIGAAAIGMAIAMPGIGAGLAWMTLGMQNAIIGSLFGLGASSIMAGAADALKGNQGGIAVGVTTPIGPWTYIYGTQKVGGIEIFRESNNNTGVSGSTSNDKQLHRVYCLACHPCALGSWQLRIDGKQVLMNPSGSDYVSYSPTQTTLNISSISRTAGVVTMVLSGSMPAGTKGSTLLVTGVADNTMNGTWTVSQPNPADFTTWTYVCGGSNSSSSGGKAKTTYSDYKDKIRVSFLNGNHTSTFATLLAAGTSWSASDLCLGRTLAYVQMGYDESVFPSSIPNVSFVIDGKNNIWDPRSSTYGFTKNPALIIADYLCMPVTQGGFGLTMGTDIPSAALIAAANKCDEAVNLNAGGTTPRYTCNTFFMLNQGRGTTLKNLLSSCAGRITYQGGQYSIQPGQWVAPTLSLTDADLVGPIQWKPRFSIRDTCNGVKGTYVSPENAYQQADVPAYQQDVAHGFVSDPWLAEDGGERIYKECNFPCTDSSAIAQRLAKIALLRTRFQGRGTIRCGLRAYQAVALDTIQLTHPHYGWSSKVLEVTSSRFVLDKSGETPVPVVELDIAETDSSIYDWNPIEQLTPQGYQQPNNVGARICSPPEQVIAYSGTGGVVNGITCPSTITTRADGTVANSIYVEWTTPNDGNVVHGGHIEVQWQAVGASGWTSLGKVDPSINYASIAGVSDGASYNVQVRAVNSAGVPSDWVQAYPYPVVVSNASSSINPVNISFPVPIGTRVAPCPIPARPTLYDLMPMGQYSDSTAANAHTLLLNPNFIAGSAGWQVQSGWSVIAGTPAVAGSTNIAQMTTAGGSIVNTQNIPCAAGNVLTVSAFAQCSSGSGSPVLFFVFYNASGGQVGNPLSAGVAADGAWHQLRLVATAPAGAVYAQAGMYSNSATGTWNASGFAASLLANSLAEVPDASGRYAAPEPSSNNTALHAASSQVIPSGNYTVTSNLPIPGLSWSANSYGTSDLWNVSAAVVIQNQSSSASATVIFSVWDGTTGVITGIQFVVPPGVYSYSAPLSLSFSGLAAGSHTIQVRVACTSGSAMILQLGSYAVLQHVY